MIMKISVVGLLVVSLFTPAWAQDATHCVDVYKTEAGTNCGSSDSLLIRYRNSCTSAIDAQVCLERSNGRWECGVYSDMDSGDTSSHFVCKASGRYRVAGRAPGSNIRFTKP